MDETRIQQLVEAALDQNLTPEEVCGACPELLPFVRQRHRQVLGLQEELAQLFPGADSRTYPGGRDPVLRPDIPAIPGYQILEVLGQGGMGVVYKARQLPLNRLVALKMILAVGPVSLEEKVRFQIEAETVARLQHPHVVQIHEIGNHQGRPFFSMEFCSGGSLVARLRQASLAPEEAAVLVEKLARAVHYAHGCGVVHRDLKPGNVLLTQDGEPKVGDFGLAKRLDAASGLSTTGQILGTPGYLAPEQALGRATEVGPAADTYALGVILYELLTGQKPFDGSSTLDILDRVRTEEPVPPSHVRSAVPRDLETICLKCLRKEPAQRYDSADELANELNRWRRGEPIRARPVGLGERTLKWIRRRPAFAVAVILGVLLLGSLVAGSLVVAVLESRHASDLTTSNAELQHKQAEIQEAVRRAQTNEATALAWKNQVGRLNVELLLDKGIDLCQKGMAAQGLFRLAEAVEVGEQVAAPEALVESARLNLALWSRELRPLRGVFRHHAGYSSEMLGLTTRPRTPTNPRPWQYGHKVLAFHPRRPLLFACEDHTGALLDLDAGTRVGVDMSHSATLYSAAFSPDGAVLLTAGADNTLRRWNGATGAALGDPLTHPQPVRAVEYARDGKTFLSVSGPEVTLWDAATFRPRRPPLRHAAQVLAATFSPEGQYVLAGCQDATAQLWEVASGRRVGSVSHLGRQFVNGEVHLVRFAPDGKTMATAYDGVCLWSVPSCRPIGAPITPKGVTWTTEFSPDSKTLLTTGAYDGLAVWDAATGTRLAQREFSPAPEGTITALAFSPTGERLAVSSLASLLRVWHVGSRTAEGPGVEHAAGVSYTAFSPRADFLVTWTTEGRLCVWAAQGERPAPQLLTTTGQPLVVSPDARTLAVTQGQAVTLLEAKTGQQRGPSLPHPDPARAACFSADGAVLLTGDARGQLRRWDVAQARLLDPPRACGQPITELEGNASATTLWINRSLLWRHDTGQTRRLAFPEPFRHRPALLADGEVWSAAPGRTQVQVRSAWSGREVGAPLLGNLVVNVTAFSADGQTIALGDTASRAQVYRWRDGEWHPTCPPLPTQEAVFRLWLSPNGQRLLTAGKTPDLPARLWAPDTGQRLGPELAGVVAAAFSPDSRILAIADRDRRVRLWHAPTGKPLGPAYPFPALIRQLRFSSENTTLVIEDESRRLWTWELAARPVSLPADRLRPWVGALTGLAGDANGVLRSLTPQDWRTCQQQARGAPP